MLQITTQFFSDIPPKYLSTIKVSPPNMMAPTSLCDRDYYLDCQLHLINEVATLQLQLIFLVIHCQGIYHLSKSATNMTDPTSLCDCDFPLHKRLTLNLTSCYGHCFNTILASYTPPEHQASHHSQQLIIGVPFYHFKLF